MLEVKLYLEQSTKLKRGTEKLIILTEVYKDIEKILKLELPKGAGPPSSEAVLDGREKQYWILDATCLTSDSIIS